MPDRILRDELWESERFLALPSDTDRLIYVRFLSEADDFGNFEGGEHRLFRKLDTATQVKSTEATSGSLERLIGCDLLRRYVCGDKEYFHIPRFYCHRQYKARKVPASPWCNQNEQLGKEKRRSSSDVVTTSQPHSNFVAQGVGVGVSIGVGVEEKKRSKPAALALAEPPPALLGEANEAEIPKAARVLLDAKWDLPEAWGIDAEALGWQRREIIKEAEKFRQYWVAGKGAGTRRGVKGWRQAWSNWLVNAEKFKR